MTDYYVRQNLLSSNCRTVIKNEKGDSIFLLVGRWGTRGDVLSLYQMNGKIVASIKQATFAFSVGSRFDLYQEFKKVGTLQRILSVNRDFYYIHKLGWVVLGDIPNHHYEIHQLNHKIMEMNKHSTLTGDFYVLSVDEEKYAPLCICISAVLDYWIINRGKSKEQLKNILPKLSFE